VIGIFMGAVWAYDFFWLFWGPEMQQWERDEEKEAALEYERLMREGLSAREIGEMRVREENAVDIGLGAEQNGTLGNGTVDEKERDGTAEHIESA
jgi:hypothetical protein